MARLTFLQIRKSAFAEIWPVLLSSCSQATYILNTLTLPRKPLRGKRWVKPLRRIQSVPRYGECALSIEEKRGAWHVISPRSPCRGCCSLSTSHLLDIGKKA